MTYNVFGGTLNPTLLRDLGNVVKITDYEYTKSHAIFCVLLCSASKNAKLKGTKIM